MLPWHYSFRACSYSKHEEDGTEAGSFGHWSTNSPNEGPLLGGFLWKPQRNTILWQVVENPSTFQKGFSFSPQTCELWQAWPATGCWWSWGLTSLCSLCHTPRLGLCICPTKKRKKTPCVLEGGTCKNCFGFGVKKCLFGFPGQIHIPWLTIKAPRFGKRKRCHQLSQPWRPVICKRWKEFYRKRLCLECGSTALRELRGLQSSVKIVSTAWYHRLSYVVFFFPWKCAAGFPLAHPWSLLCLWCVCWRRQTWQSLKNIQSQSSGAWKFTLTLSDPSVSKLLAWWFWCHEIVDFV